MEVGFFLYNILEITSLLVNFKEYKLKYNTLRTEFINEQFRKDVHIGPSL